MLATFKAGILIRVNPGDQFHLSRFVEAQKRVYATALSELQNGRKRSHWMWFIFPQYRGLGFSAMSARYAISSLAEARAYLDHPALSARLLECTHAVLDVEGKTAAEIFGHPDDWKLRSCMTLFEQVAGEDSVFSEVLEKYYGGERDEKTAGLIQVG